MASELINSTCDASLDLVEAKWLCSVFTDSVTGVLTPPNSTRKAFDTFMSLIDSPDDSCKMRALCYAGIVYYNCQIRKLF